MNKVKTVRITLCTFRAATSSPNARPTEFILKRFPTTTSAKVTAQNRSNRAGATPLFRLSAAQKVRGVAPARYTGSVTAFCSRAQRELLRKTSETILPLATHRSRIDLNRRVEANVSFLRGRNG